MTTQGLLGKGVTTANQNKSFYTVPAGFTATGTISLLNTGTTDVNVRVYIGNATNPTLADAIEYGAKITPGGILERSCLPIGEGESVVVFAPTNSVTVRVSGFTAANPA